MAKKKQTVRESPIDDLTYDVVTIIYEKTKGLEAYEKYLEDASDDEELLEVLETSQANDRECVEQLTTHLRRLLGQTPRMSEGGNEKADEQDDQTSQRGRPKKSA